MSKVAGNVAGFWELRLPTADPRMRPCYVLYCGEKGFSLWLPSLRWVEGWTSVYMVGSCVLFAHRDPNTIPLTNCVLSQHHEPHQTPGSARPSPSRGRPAMTLSSTRPSTRTWKGCSWGCTTPPAASSSSRSAASSRPAPPAWPPRLGSRCVWVCERAIASQSSPFTHSPSLPRAHHHNINMYVCRWPCSAAPSTRSPSASCCSSSACLSPRLLHRQSPRVPAREEGSWRHCSAPLLR